MLKLYQSHIPSGTVENTSRLQSTAIDPQRQFRTHHRGTQSWTAQSMAGSNRHGVRRTHASSVCPTKATPARASSKGNAENLEATLHVPHQASSDQDTQTVQTRLHQQPMELQMDRPKQMYRQQLEQFFSGLRIKYRGTVYLVGGWGGSIESGMWTRLWIAADRCVPAVKCIPLAGIPCARWRRKVKSNAYLVFDPEGNIIGIGQDWFGQKAKEQADNILASWAKRYRIKPQKGNLYNKPYRTITGGA